MKAIVADAPDRLDMLRLADVPVPAPDAGEVLVRLHAIGVGLHDRWFLPPDARFPYPIGIEGAGVIEACGAGVTGFAPGDRVLFVNSLQPKGGTWAEFTVVPRRALVPVPAGLDFVHAAALPVAGGTAMAAMRQVGPVAGATLFIGGASGAIGTLAVQLARAHGMRVAASASAANRDYLRGLGAELAVDYRAPGWVDVVRDWGGCGVDAAIAIPAGTGADSIHTVRDGGRLVTISGDRVAPERGITVSQVTVEGDTAQALAGLAVDVAQGRIRLGIERVYPFVDAVAALEKTETRHARGKIIVQAPGAPEST